jgi:hypothetical protein
VTLGQNSAPILPMIARTGGGEPQILAAGYDRSQGLNLQSGFVIVPPPTPQNRQVKCCAPVGGMVAFLPVFYPPPDHPCLRTQEGEDHRQNRLDHVTSDVPPVLKFPPVATSSFRGQVTPLPVPRRAIASIRGVTSRLDWFENVQGVSQTVSRVPQPIQLIANVIQPPRFEVRRI